VIVQLPSGRSGLLWDGLNGPAISGRSSYAGLDGEQDEYNKCIDNENELQPFDNDLWHVSRGFGVRQAWY
jgi:hypothetical protein